MAQTDIMILENEYFLREAISKTNAIFEQSLLPEYSNDDQKHIDKMSQILKQLQQMQENLEAMERC